MSVYDIDTEEDTMYIIRAQNKKIQNLYSELESKESSLQQLMSECSRIKIFEEDLENSKRQNFTLNEKIKVLHNSLEAHHRESNDQIRLSLENENRLKFQLESKDKIIFDCDETIKKYEIQINKYKKDLNEKSLSITELRNENEDLKNNLKNYTLKFSVYEEDIKKIKKEKREIGNLYSEAKYNFDNKAQELVDLIKQQNLELYNMSSKVVHFESNIKALKNTNSRLKSQIDDLIYENKEKNSEISNLRYFENLIKEKEKTLFMLDKDFEIERNKNIDLKFNLEKITHKNSELIEKIYDLEKLKDFLKSKDEEINILKNQIDSLEENLKEKEIFIKKLEVDITNYIIYINENIHTSLKWADTYLGVYMDSSHTTGISPFINYENFQTNQANKNMKEYSFSNNASLIYSHSKLNDLFLHEKVKFNIDQFSQIFFNIQKRLNKDLQQYEETIYELKNENSGLSQRIDFLLNENYSLKDEKVIQSENQSSIQQDLHKYKTDFEYYKNLYDITDKKKKDIEHSYNSYFEELISQFRCIMEKFKNSSNSKISEMVEFSVNNTPTQTNKDIFRDYIYNFIEKLEYFINEYETSSQKLMEYNQIKYDLESLKTEFQDCRKNFEIEQDILIKENDEKLSIFQNIKINELKNIDNSYKTKIERLKNSLEEKEEIIQKINNEYNLLKVQTNFIENNFEEYKKSIKEYEKDLFEKYEKVQIENKNLEMETSKLKNELELNILHIKQIETNFQKKVYEVETLKKSRDDSNILDWQESLKLAEDELKMKDGTIKRLVNELKNIQQQSLK